MRDREGEEAEAADRGRERGSMGERGGGQRSERKRPREEEPAHTRQLRHAVGEHVLQIRPATPLLVTCLLLRYQLRTPIRCTGTEMHATTLAATHTQSVLPVVGCTLLRHTGSTLAVHTHTHCSSAVLYRILRRSMGGKAPR
eukprot:1959844-Rhodomonas_salina.1